VIIVEAFDFGHALVSEVNSDGTNRGNVWGAAMLAGQFFPLVLAFLPMEGLSKGQAFLYFPIAFVPALAYAWLRRSQIRSVRAALPKPVPQRARVVGAIFFFVSTWAAATAARVSPLAAGAFLLAFACLPWRHWAGCRVRP